MRTVVGLSGTLVHLAEDGGPNSAMQLPFLLASEGFEIVGQAAVSRPPLSAR